MLVGEERGAYSGQKLLFLLYVNSRGKLTCHELQPALRPFDGESCLQLAFAPRHILPYSWGTKAACGPFFRPIVQFHPHLPCRSYLSSSPPAKTLLTDNGPLTSRAWLRSPLRCPFVAVRGSALIVSPQRIHGYMCLLRGEQCLIGALASLPESSLGTLMTRGPPSTSDRHRMLCSRVTTLQNITAAPSSLFPRPLTLTTYPPMPFTTRHGAHRRHHQAALHFYAPKLLLAFSFLSRASGAALIGSPTSPSRRPRPAHNQMTHSRALTPGRRRRP
jgi:hypothetical protein